MLNNISWSSFFWMLMPMIIFYYLYVAGVYFRKDFYFLLTPHKKSEKDHRLRANVPGQEPHHTKTISPSHAETDTPSTTGVHEFIEDLKFLFAKASKTNMVKEELVQAIRSCLKKYPGIGQTGLEEEINWHITAEAKDHCRMDLLPEDLKFIWST
jgi:cbb3-type cytochrome oxidase subunit 3